MGFFDDFEKEIHKRAAIEFSRDKDRNITPHKAAGFYYGLGYDTEEEQKDLWKRMAILGAFDKKKVHESVVDSSDNCDVSLENLSTSATGGYLLLKMEAVIFAIVSFVFTIKVGAGLFVAMIPGVFAFFVLPRLAVRYRFMATVARIMYITFWTIFMYWLGYIREPIYGVITAIVGFAVSLLVHKVLGK